MGQGNGQSGNNASGAAPKAWVALAAGVARLWAERQAAFLLAAFYTVVTLALFRPILEFQAAAAKTMFRPELALPEGELPRYIVIVWLLALLVYVGLAVVWLRLILLGPARALEGGAQAFTQRVGMALWRNICGAGWMLVVMVPVAFLIETIGGALFGGGAGIIVGQKMSPGLVLVAIMVLIPMAFIAASVGVAMVAASFDRALTVREAFLGLGDNRFAAFACWAVVFVLSLSVISSAAGLIVFGLLDLDASPRIEAVLYASLISFGNALAIFVWLSATSEYALPVLDSQSRRDSDDDD